MKTDLKDNIVSLQISFHWFDVNFKTGNWKAV